MEGYWVSAEIKEKKHELEGIVTDYKYGFKTEHKNLKDTGKGISEAVVREISAIKGEPEWMLNYRLKAYAHFAKTKMPAWGPDLSEIDFDEYTYYIKPSEKAENSWEDVPDEIKDTFDKLGIPEAEAKFLSGVSTQYESEVPKGVKIEKPLQSYFRINTESMGQFERTLIIVDEGADIHYVEGCTAPTYSADSLHAAVVEIYVRKGGRCRYSTIQNWSNNILNLVTKRAVCEDYAHMEWIDGNIGSKITMKYPACVLKGEGAKGTTISIAFAGEGQIQDAGAKMIHLAPNTSSTIISKSLSRNGGNVTYRGIVEHGKKAKGAKSHVECDTIILDSLSKSDTIPYNIVKNDDVTIQHEATVSKVSEEQLFYLMSRGLTEEQATEMIVMGFIEPFAKELPMEYAVELNQLLKLEMNGSIG